MHAHLRPKTHITSLTDSLVNNMRTHLPYFSHVQHMRISDYAAVTILMYTFTPIAAPIAQCRELSITVCWLFSTLYYVVCFTVVLLLAAVPDFGIASGQQLLSHECSFVYNSSAERQGWFLSPNFPGNYPR